MCVVLNTVNPVDNLAGQKHLYTINFVECKNIQAILAAGFFLSLPLTFTCHALNTIFLMSCLNVVRESSFQISIKSCLFSL